jgi:hypothetical protein
MTATVTVRGTRTVSTKIRRNPTTTIWSTTFLDDWVEEEGG